MPLRNLCVFCASADGTQPAFRSAAEELGTELARRHIGLIYGGARVGLMGAVSSAVLRHGGTVIGVVPHVLVDKEIAEHGCTELHVVDTMHTRKALMSEKADAFLILPGGYGTLEEMFEVLTWQSIGLHTKPVCLLNTAGFYDGLLTFLDSCVMQGVLRPAARANLLTATTVAAALHQVEAAVAPADPYPESFVRLT